MSSAIKILNTLTKINCVSGFPLYTFLRRRLAKETIISFQREGKRIYTSGLPRSLETRENMENGQSKFPAEKNQGISK